MREAKFILTALKSLATSAALFFFLSVRLHTLLSVVTKGRNVFALSRHPDCI